ncbi:CBL-interacting serine/threonine-protein kinase 7-like [Magnolia sinica]|uniref:CBL-interacting serine/threonine-protein kinase 7-like n=1 Tax=Magnolia sinica TaxID=86752 RepID=UPI00265A369C|nr:CBL-interacting serine/threonine-protein kinase 7-like [Magnolia sinica]
MESGPDPTITPTSPNVVLGKYELGSLLGRGKFSKVYQARSLVDETVLVAMKVIDKSKIKNTTMEPRIIREVSIMHHLHHPNIINLHEVMATKSKIYLVMEHASGGDLFSQITHHGPLSEPIARRYFQQLISALHFCHSNGVAHRDIKPQNLLLDDDGNLKVTDFGLSALPEQLKGGFLHTACGTPAYTAPEVVRRKGYDGPKADAWSCGIVLFILLAGYLPFDDANIAVMYQKIYRREFKFPFWFSKPVRRLISQLLDPQPQTRISINALMQVAWFKKSYRSTLWHVNQPNFCTIQKDDRFDLVNGAPVMTAFDLISLSSGLDLSGLFEATNKKEKRFTSNKPAKDILENFKEIGRKLNYKVEIKKVGCVELLKNQLVMSVEVAEVVPSLLLVEMKVFGDTEMDFELYWEDLKVGIEDLVLVWNNDGI